MVTTPQAPERLCRGPTPAVVERSSAASKLSPRCGARSAHLTSSGAGLPYCSIKSRSSNRRDSRFSCFARIPAMYPETRSARPARHFPVDSHQLILGQTDGDLRAGHTSIMPLVKGLRIVPPTELLSPRHPSRRQPEVRRCRRSPTRKRRCPSRCIHGFHLAERLDHVESAGVCFQAEI